MAGEKINRRRFLVEGSGAVLGIVGFGFLQSGVPPYIVSSSALGNAGYVAANDRIVMGFIGMGNQGTAHMGWRGGDVPNLNWVEPGGFMGSSEVQVVAVCDIDARWRNRARDIVNKYYGNKDCATYKDFRELLVREDIDAVVTATPSHWNAIVDITAAKAGKDIYCEKPMSLTIAEARAMAHAVGRYGRIFQIGTQQRSDRNFRFACELVRNGYIGEVKTVTVGVGGPAGPCNLPAEPVPDYLNWDMWLGPALWRPYHPGLLRHGWMGYWDYGGGEMTNWGPHHFDIAQWGLGMDDSGPVEIIPPDGKDYKVLTYKYANGVTMTRDNANGVLFTGTEGKVEVNRGYLRTWPGSLARQKIGSNEIHLYESKSHQANFLSCIRTRRKPASDAETGCRSTTVCHLGNLAYRLKRPLKWDPDNERFIGDEQANRMLSRPMRSGWHL